MPTNVSFKSLLMYPNQVAELDMGIVTLNTPLAD